jgi:hypothetical protein
MTEAITDTHRAKQDCDPETPHARKAERQHGKPDQLKEAESLAESRQEALVDEGLEESFPASDPLSAKRIT